MAMGDSGGPHHHRPSPPPLSDAGKRRRLPNVRLAGSVPLPSHLPHPRRVPIVPATRSRKPLHLQHNSNHQDQPTAEPEPPQTLLKPFADSGDDVVLAAAFPRKARAPRSAALEEANGGPEDSVVLAAAFPRKARAPRSAAAAEANGGPEDSETETEMEEQEEAPEEVVDVPSWLWGMGMGRYAAAFEAHEVDAEVLPWLTMDDLRDMGIGAVGARRKLFCAIQRLASQPPPRR